jgi:hypothetical protein
MRGRATVGAVGANEICACIDNSVAIDDAILALPLCLCCVSPLIAAKSLPNRANKRIPSAREFHNHWRGGAMKVARRRDRHLAHSHKGIVNEIG